MSNANEPAFPHYALDNHGNPLGPTSRGLTKRELFAAMAMQGYKANNDVDFSSDEAMARRCVECADALLEELDLTQEEK